MIHWLDIATQIRNMFDYKEYSQAAGNSSLSVGEYAQKVGMLMVARNIYLDKSPEAAYLQFLDDINSMKGASTKPCGNCGGAKVR